MKHGKLVSESRKLKKVEAGSWKGNLICSVSEALTTYPMLYYVNRAAVLKDGMNGTFQQWLYGKPSESVSSFVSSFSFPFLNSFQISAFASHFSINFQLTPSHFSLKMT